MNPLPWIKNWLSQEEPLAKAMDHFWDCVEHEDIKRKEIIKAKYLKHRKDSVKPMPYTVN